MKKRDREDLVDKILDAVVVCDANPKKVGALIQRWFKDKGIDLSELKAEDFNRRIK